MTTLNTRAMAALVTCLVLSTPALAAEHAQADDSIDYPYKDVELTPCGVKKTEAEINLLPAPQAIKVGDITYVSGGVCLDDAQYMKNVAKDYPLEVVLVEKTIENEKESYIADVHVKIINAEEKVLLDIRTEGPFLLANLPDGDYQISANYDNNTQIKEVKVNHKKHARVVFLWAKEPL